MTKTQSGVAQAAGWPALRRGAGAAGHPDTQTEKDDLRQALTQLRPHFRRAAWFSGAAGLLVLVPTLYMLQVYDRVITSRSSLTLLMLALLVLGAYLVMELLELARVELLHGAGMQLDRQLRGRVFAAGLEARLRQLGASPATALHDLAQLRQFLSSPLMLALLGLPVTLVFVGLLFALHPLLGWAALCGGVLQGWITWTTGQRTRPGLAQAQQYEQQARTLAEQGAAQPGTVQVLGMWPALRSRWQASAAQAARGQAMAHDTASGLNASSRLLQLLMSSLLLGLAAWLVLRDTLAGGAGMMIVGSVLGARVLAPLVQIAMHWRSLQGARQAWARLHHLLAKLPARAPAMPLPTPQGRVQVDAVTAAPPGQGEPVLRQVSFDLQPGEVLAIVGPSGAGKSSLARVPMGLWTPLRGAVRLDGADVATWDRQELGPHLGYLPQEVELLEGSIAENIARFSDADADSVEAAARLVGLHDWIASLPQGYDTPVGPGGVWLSGGQRQRVGLARAFHGRPAWVVLDEPNASLDAAGDQALLQAVRQHQQAGGALAVVTHRRSILAVCDKVLVLKGGSVLAFGPRDDVLKPAGLQTENRVGLPSRTPVVGAAA